MITIPVPIVEYLIPNVPNVSIVVTYCYRYLVTHIDELQALVIVRHAGSFYNLYLSDESGVYYSLSLRDIVLTQGQYIHVDLELVTNICILVEVQLWPNIRWECGWYQVLFDHTWVHKLWAEAVLYGFWAPSLWSN